MENEEQFQAREVGLSHPDLEGFIRINDDSVIEIVASDSLSILMNPRNNSITFVADSIKFFTDSIRWNDVELNDQATNFTEPTFIPVDDTLEKGLYQGVDYFLEEGETL